MEEIKLYTAEETAAILKVTRRTMYNYITSGKIKAVKAGRSWRITEEAIREFLSLSTSQNG